MKYILSLMILVLAMPAFAGGYETSESNYVDYITLSAGVNLRSDETVSGLPSNYTASTDNDTGQSGYLTIGKDMGSNIDIELEVAVNQNDAQASVTKTRRHYSNTYTSDFDIATYSIGLNTRYNITQFTVAGITPNVFIGGGVESIHFDNNELGGSETGLYGQIGAGLEKSLGENWSLIGDYRYRKGQDINYQGFEIGNELQIFTVGAKLKL